MFIGDDHYSLANLLSGQPYLNRHPKVPRDFAVLPFNILVSHIEETLGYVQRLARELTSTEKRIAEGSISLDDNGDYKLLNRLSLEHLRVQRRSNFELELAENLSKYIEEYHNVWRHLWEGGTSYIEEMREKIEQQTRYAKQVHLDLEVIPRRIKGQSKAVRTIDDSNPNGETDRNRSSISLLNATMHSISSWQRAPARSRKKVDATIC